jgi:hypothetical protein
LPENRKRAKKQLVWLIKSANLMRIKMKNRFKYLTIGLVAVFAVSACAPVATAIATSVPVIPTEAPALPATSTPLILPPASTETVLPVTPSPVVEVLPIATSRGPDLEATDPTTVALASGGLQLVEFFRFT